MEPHKTQVNIFIHSHTVWPLSAFKLMQIAFLTAIENLNSFMQLIYDADYEAKIGRLPRITAECESISKQIRIFHETREIKRIES